MKRIETDRFKAMMIRGSGFLPTESENIEGVKSEIDYVNARAIERGYKPLQYAIIHVETYTYLDDDGEFVKRETIEQAIEKYPTEAI